MRSLDQKRRGNETGTRCFQRMLPEKAQKYGGYLGAYLGPRNGRQKRNYLPRGSINNLGTQTGRA